MSKVVPLIKPPNTHIEDSANLILNALPKKRNAYTSVPEGRGAVIGFEGLAIIRVMPTAIVDNLATQISLSTHLVALPLALPFKLTPTIYIQEYLLRRLGSGVIMRSFMFDSLFRDFTPISGRRVNYNKIESLAIDVEFNGVKLSLLFPIATFVIWNKALLIDISEPGTQYEHHHLPGFYSINKALKKFNQASLTSLLTTKANYISFMFIFSWDEDVGTIRIGYSDISNSKNEVIKLEPDTAHFNSATYNVYYAFLRLALALEPNTHELPYGILTHPKSFLLYHPLTFNLIYHRGQPAYLSVTSPAYPD